MVRGLVLEETVVVVKWQRWSKGFVEGVYSIVVVYRRKGSEDIWTKWILSREE